MLSSSSSDDRGRGGGGPPSSRGNGAGDHRDFPLIDRASVTVPRGICRAYWTTGACNFGFDCRFKHEAKPQVIESSSPSQPADYTPYFFTAEGLAVNSSSVIDPRHTLSPSEVHNYLKPYLADNFSFRDAINVEGFSRILASVNSRNRAWDSNQAQAFLDTVVRSDALRRIGDVLRFSPIAVNVGARSSTLSYQKGYFPILEFLSSDLVLKTAMHQNTNKVYTLIDQNYDEFRTTICGCTASMIDAQTWKDRSPGLPASRQNLLCGVVVFKTLSTVLSQYLGRFKGAMRNHPDLRDLVEDLFSWFNRWTTAVKASPPSFQDPITTSSPEARSLILGQLGKDINRLRLIVGREYGRAERMRLPVARTGVTVGQMRQALTSRLEQAYDPPGTLRERGLPRHDNDFTDIRDIRIAPTHEELSCSLPPYLPVFLPVAPHHLPENSMERHLDIQFRLLREEMISTIRQSIAEIRNDLEIMWAPRTRPNRKPTTLEQLLWSKGGAYKTSGTNSVFFHLYTGARFVSVRAERSTFTVGLRLDAPPGGARDQSRKKRTEYWEHSKRLQLANLVALILVSPDQSKVYFGTVVSTSRDIEESAKEDAENIRLRISFFDAKVELMALRRQPISIDASTYAILLDNNIMFESLHPFLETLQNVEPTSIPFSHIISSSGSLESLSVEPPRYARVPGFRFDLQCLARSGQSIPSLDASDVKSATIARKELLRSSNLDPSQVDALVDTLTREVSLIQGPPGTGKSFTGKEILRALFSNKIRPIVLIAFTNHAVDHMLTSILDAAITTNVVRLGSGTKNERIAQYNLYKRERNAELRDLKRHIGRQYASMKGAEREITRIMNQIQHPQLTWEVVESFLDLHYPNHADPFRHPPSWIVEVFRQAIEDENENGTWTLISGGKEASQDSQISGIYGFWKNGQDIEFIQTPSSSKTEVEDGDDPRVAFFHEHGFQGQVPPVPSECRSLERLTKGVNDVWSMSLTERRCLTELWEKEMHQLAYDSNLAEFERFRLDYKNTCKSYECMRDEVRRTVLSETDLIACTTTGAAKLVSLLASIEPKVVMVEEAGQVLEAHILASLVPSVEHLICIGDPKQLRANLSTFALSMDSARGKELYKFDRSLMERLSDAGMSMSQINMQRRMRPTISHFVRTILYPTLEDHVLVHHYPPVQGMEKDVFFLSHANPEGAEADSVSRYNMFEVAMIRDLVLYFLKQGPYNGVGDIAVLCAYLGQLQKVRVALRDLEIEVKMDERDEEMLERTGLVDDEVGFAQVQVASHIRLGTVDTFQGEEAKVVIISLVRNSGSFEEGDGSIGFLKSSNRINVALSRAKHGLYILGNASNLRSNETWREVLDEMEEENQIGYAFPIVCPRHPSTRHSISKPGELPTLAPEGGCIKPCGFRLSCGHICPSKCHTDQDNHRRMKCNQPCARVTCPRAHPCPLLCSDDCGDCNFPIVGAKLPCKHTAVSVPCHMLGNLEAVFCVSQVLKRLTGCEHSAVMACSEDPSSFVCKEVCGDLTVCCLGLCTARCHECQKVTQEKATVPSSSFPLVRLHHRNHPCQRLLKCQHPCGLLCSSDHSCNQECPERCRQRCVHRKCEEPCWMPCPPCTDRCKWRCPHESCPVVCGSICSRLPCDRPCDQQLLCGHGCPSICGEPCEEQTCIVCLPAEQKVDIVDFIMYRTLAEIDLDSEDISERLIKLECGHIFTVETLDQYCTMSEYYEIDHTGVYVATKAPPVNYQTPPSCPTCHGPITALRYGRVTKRANLDILEQNVARTMSLALERVSPEIEDFSAKLQGVKEEARKIPFRRPAKTAQDFDLLTDHRRNQFGKESEPLPHGAIDQSGMTVIHGFSREEGRAWKKIVRDLLRLYKIVSEVARKQGPHIQAYSAALAALYRLELAAIAGNPVWACENPEQLAMDEVNKKIGQPPHKAGARFQVEGFFLSLEFRYTLAEIAQARIEGLNTASLDHDIVWHARLWRSYVSFIYESCILDAGKALTIAQRSSAARLAARAEVYILRGKLEKFRFEILTKCALLARDGLLFDSHRQRYSGRAQQKGDVTAARLKKLEATYLGSRPVVNMDEVNAARDWFTQNCRKRGDRYVEEYRKLATHLLTGRGYVPRPLQEKADIVKSFGFSHGGRFYNCENGHSFVIADCGGATESARCPECRVPVRGSGHQPRLSNTRAMELEDVARQQSSLGAF